MSLVEQVRQHLLPLGITVHVSDEELDEAVKTLKGWLSQIGDTFESRMDSMIGICCMVMSSPSYWYVFQHPRLKNMLQEQIAGQMNYCVHCEPSNPLYCRAQQVLEVAPKALVYIKGLPDFVVSRHESQKRRASDLEAPSSIRQEL